MANINKDWIDAPQSAEEYIKGVENFLDFAFLNSTMDTEEDDKPEILCPCMKCVYRFWFPKEEIFSHLIANRFNKRYKVWNFHGEGFTTGSSSREDGHQCDNQNTLDNMDEMINDIFRDFIGGSSSDAEELWKGPDESAKKFYKLLEDAREELYPGCKNFSVLSYTVRLYLLKCLNGWSNSSFDKLMELQCDAFPFAKLPTSFHHAKKMEKNLGLNYKRIDACPNDCMLYWKERANDKSFHVCKASRWKLNEKQKEEGALPDEGVPAKFLRYFPLKPRLQKLFMCSKTAELMTWHETDRKKDDKLRHPADGQAWKDFDAAHPQFASDFRNVRLGLTTDGFNPLRTMSVSYSIWLVVLSIYNLPPWLYNKSKYNITPLIIPGPPSLGYDIDVYLQPLIEELKELWEVGVDTYDAVKDETFSLKASLLWTISDFPAYAMLSGWSTKGEFACPNCNHKTWSKYLKYSGKMCYMGHRRSLKENHHWRRNKRAFDGNVETRPPPPTRFSGSEVLKDLEGFENKFGKTQKKGRKKFPWKKKSIFFELPYWETNTLRHNLNVMHIEKNICDSVLGNLLDIPGKTKDHVASRFDLQDMGIRNELHPKRTNNRGKRLYSKACFSLSSSEKALFCSVMKGAKFPDGCASNISRCVQSNERKIAGYKSHDAHFMLHYLLQVVLKNVLPKQVASTLIRLGSFFRGLCRKVLKPKDLVDLESEIIQILCQLEKIFPPSFFDIMIHLSLHLVEEARLGGLVQGRWMYPKERYLGKLKSYVKNRSRPEGSIVEAYLEEECLIFCSRYLHDDFSSKLNGAPRNDDDTASNEDGSLFS
ncbi:uncharacterized protein LOC110701677 [Chenopodium quinoa]|uniref:uncharacterized protein LOC110701677 n=1 Tax=Chenopodium quinoa TaxID=63459 RepID=UPI000B777323|nr:uncharacterized protein LOC110701677 [Chenopodium quinoa]XP_021734986.1 uncharacterized protein LOC110701677 [Chenopodium quinoa]XP_021734987.1 uncharacterized protein LOC110701677 [Chenopodium quinoa]